MKRFSSFLFGMAVGAGLLFGALNFHVVRANDGMHLVRKIDAKLAGSYVDIRTFTVTDWARNPDLAVALVNAGRQDLVQGSATDALRNRLDHFLDAGRPQ